MKRKPLRIGRFLTVLAATAALACGAWWSTKRYVARRVGAVATARPQAAREALRELAGLDAAAVAPLLDAAVHADDAIAAPARRELERLVRRRARRSRRTGEVDGVRLASRVLSGVLARESRLTPSGRAWASELAELVLHRVEGDPAREAKLIAQCEQLYEVALQPSPPPERPDDSSASTGRAAPAAPAPALSTPPSVAAHAPPPSVPHSRPTRATAAPPAVTPAPPDNPPPFEVTLSHGQWSAAAPAPSVTEAIAPRKASRSTESASGLGWRAPAPADRASVPQSPVDQPQAAASDPSTAAPAREAAPNGVKSMLAGDERQRLELVNQLLTGRHDGAPHVLLKLARDPSPRVRASAISALGTSQDRRLTEAAWRLAMQDEDPRVARLARELRKLLR